MKSEKIGILFRILALVIFTSMLIPTVVLAQKEDKEKSKQEKKDEKQNKKDQDRLEKNVRRYEEVLGKALEKYSKDLEFRNDVDYEYRQLQRDHAKVAFEVNTFDGKDYVMTASGDKLPRNDDTLYDNLTAQDYVNRVGQSLVPANSEKLYGFKITVNPMPDARSLSTGTIYISTGLLSMVDNEAQLAYILSHEIAHIEKDHWKQDIVVAKWIQEDAETKEKRNALFGAIGGVILGGITRDVGNMMSMGVMGAGIGIYVAKLANRNSFEWSPAQEDESDRLAMDYMLKRNYDVREVQTFYETLKTAANEDPRIGLDRFADRKRTEERRRAVNAYIASADTSALAKTTFGATNLRGKAISIDRNSIVTINRIQKNQEAMSDEIKLKLQSGEIMAGDGEFENIMAILKRDNGVVAFYYDMYKLASRNLSQSLAVRSDDALGYFYYGKVLKLTARKPGERETALQMFSKSIELDRRNANPESRLYRALTRISGRTTNNIQDVVGDLKSYVSLYQQSNGGSLPPNMSVIYDFMQEAGETNWSAFPVSNVKNISGTTSTVTTVPNPVSTPVPTKKRN